MAQYGRRELAICAAAATLLSAGIVAGAWRAGWGLLGLLAAPLGLWAWVLWFFRDPERPVPPEPDVLVSPADGRVTDLTPVGPDGPLGVEGIKIGVFMGLMDVHVNRSPDAARVVRVEHRDGSFLDARSAEASQRNECATIVLAACRDGQEHPLVVRQIAGRVARRIVTDLAEGQSVARGQRIGMIKFGSRVELLVPRALAGEVRVRVGQRVRAGRTVLAAAAQASQAETAHDARPAD